VHFLGKRQDIPEVLSSLDLFVFSSLREGLPIAVIEAMTVGLPCVVSDIGPLLEVSDGGRYAVAFRREDPDDLARKLIDLIEDSARRKQLGQQAKEWAQSRFSIEAHLANLSSLYRSLVRTTSTTVLR
jgi:glycosyltransferase involved in cell wall biosynthesis